MADNAMERGRKSSYEPTSRFIDNTPNKNSDNGGAVELALRNGKDQDSFDPFLDRQLTNPSSNASIMANFIKAAIGTGILCMPAAFKNSGYIGCTLVMLGVAVICTHCEASLIKCAHVLYYRERRCTMVYAEVAYIALRNGPKCLRILAPVIRPIIAAGLFMAYFFTCSAYTVIIARNIAEVSIVYGLFGEGLEKVENNHLRIVMAILMVPMIIVSMVPDMKKLAFLSILATISLFTGLICTMYVFVNTMASFERPVITPWGDKAGDWPETFSICIFAVEAIGVMLPFENNMKSPKSLVSTFGILNTGMVGVTFSYLIFGILGYVAFGPKTEGNVIGNLDGGAVLSQVIRVLIAIAVYFSFTLQLFVCLEVIWNGIKKHFTSRPMLFNYILRIFLVAAAVATAIAVPNILPLVGLIGAFCFSILGIIVPALIEIAALWDVPKASRKYLAIKNVLLIILGFGILVAGTCVALVDISESYL